MRCLCVILVAEQNQNGEVLNCDCKQMFLSHLVPQPFNPKEIQRLIIIINCLLA